MKRALFIMTASNSNYSRPMGITGEGFNDKASMVMASKGCNGSESYPAGYMYKDAYNEGEWRQEVFFLGRKIMTFPLRFGTKGAIVTCMENVSD